MKIDDGGAAQLISSVAAMRACISGVAGARRGSRAAASGNTRVHTCLFSAHVPRPLITTTRLPYPRRLVISLAQRLPTPTSTLPYNPSCSKTNCPTVRPRRVTRKPCQLTISHIKASYTPTFSFGTRFVWLAEWNVCLIAVTYCEWMLKWKTFAVQCNHFQNR